MRFALILSFVAFAVPSWSFSPETMREEARFGAWIVLCDSLDDMGGITYFDCAASQGETIFVHPAEAQARLIAASDGPITGLTMSPCEAGLCSDLMPIAALIDQITAGAAIDGTPIDAEGLSAALQEISRLLK